MERTGFAYAFGPYTVDPSARRLLRGSTEIPLNGKAFDLLLVFVKSGGAALGRDELYNELWSGAFVEDGNLSQNVYLLRRALGREEERCIETIPRFGYRFVAEVRRVERDAPSRAGAGAVRAAAAAALVLLLAAAGWSATPPRAPMPPAARQAYALGFFHLYLRTPREIEHARFYFEQTAARAPKRADGYAGLAATYALLAEYYPPGSKLWRYYLERARSNRDAAFAREPQNSDALAAAGFIAYRFDQNVRSAQRYLSAALAADPNNAAAHHWHAVLLLALGDTRGAVADMEAAHRIDPTSEVFMRWLARAYAYAGRPADALAILGDALRIEPQDEGSLMVLACAQEERGDLRAALQTLHVLARDPWERQFVTPDEARLEVLVNRTKTTALTKQIDRAIAARSVDSFEASLFYLTVGKRERAVALWRAPRTFVTQGLERNDPRARKLATWL